LFYRKLTGSTALLMCAIGGVCATLWFRQLPSLTYLILLLSFAIVCSIRIKWMITIAVFLFGFTWASTLFNYHRQAQLPTELEGVTLQLEGRIVGLPSDDRYRSRFRFLVEQGDDSTAMLHGRIVQLSCYRCRLKILPDQTWRLSVRLKRPNGYASWGAFDYEKYLFRHQVVAQGYVRLKEGNQLLAQAPYGVASLRWRLRQSIAEKLPNQQLAQAMISALAIGDKTGLSNHQRAVFQRAGVSHLMAISGLHVGLVFFAVAWLSKWLLMPVARVFDFLPRQQIALLPALVAAVGYSALAGFAVSTQRAIVMLGIFVLARLLARELSLFKVLLIAASIILFYDPFSILDTGFWLSFCAVLLISIVSTRGQTLSLIRLQPLLWIGMLPLSLHFFGQLSFVSPLVNLLMVPLFCSLLIPCTLFSLILMQIGMHGISRWLLGVLGDCFEWVFQGLAWVADLAIAKTSLPPMQLIHWLLFLLLAIAFAQDWRTRYALVVLCVSMLFLVRPDTLEEGELRIVLLDVGQGLSMVIETDNYTLVYDTGPAYQSGFSAAQAVLLPYLQQRDIRHIDTLVISHADNDHIGGFPVLRDAFPIAQLLSSRVDKVAGAQSCEAGQYWQVANIRFSIISPDTHTPQGSNNRSCVLKVSNGHVTALITGDIERPVERYLLDQQTDLKADIMLVPHQGSKTSSSETFIDAVNPKLAMLAAGYRNHYGHPHKTVRERYLARSIEMYSTIESGSILLNIKGNKWNVVSHRTKVGGFWRR